MRPILATFAFVLATLACAAAAAAVSGAAGGSSVRAQRGDLVAYVVPRQVASCRLREVRSGRVVALPGDGVAVRSGSVRAGGTTRSQLLVNGRAVSTLANPARAF